MRAEDYWGISMFKAWFATPLWARVLLALILGAVTGYLWGPGAESIKIVGDLFIDFIKSPEEHPVDPKFTPMGPP